MVAVAPPVPIVEARDLGHRYASGASQLWASAQIDWSRGGLTAVVTAGSVSVGELDVERFGRSGDIGGQVTELVRTTDDLAREINAEHGHVETHKHNTIRHAIRCGELLLEMKQRVGHGNWLAWVQEHFEASERTARNYMEIAKSAAVADLKDDTTMRSALRALASPSQSQKTPQLERAHPQAGNALATARIPVEDAERVLNAEVVEAPTSRPGRDPPAHLDKPPRPPHRHQTSLRRSRRQPARRPSRQRSPLRGIARSPPGRDRPRAAGRGARAARSVNRVGGVFPTAVARGSIHALRLSA